MGISPIWANEIPAMSKEKDEACVKVGKLVMQLLKQDLRPSKIITKKSVENAIAAVAMTGGSTNAVLHLLAIAFEAGIRLSIEDFDRISARTPLLGDLKPGTAFTVPPPLFAKVTDDDVEEWKDRFLGEEATE